MHGGELEARGESNSSCGGGVWGGIVGNVSILHLLDAWIMHLWDVNISLISQNIRSEYDVYNEIFWKNTDSRKMEK